MQNDSKTMIGLGLIFLMWFILTVFMMFTAGCIQHPAPVAPAPEPVASYDYHVDGQNVHVESGPGVKTVHVDGRDGPIDISVKTRP